MSNKWKHHIKIKHLFEDETTPELIVKLCNELERQLKPIQKVYETSESKSMIYYELEECIDNFEFLKHLADGTIPEFEWKDYGFEGDFKKEFNGYLHQLYNLADSDKFMWIG